jgi:hypothetical protein
MPLRRPTYNPISSTDDEDHDDDGHDGHDGQQQQQEEPRRRNISSSSSSTSTTNTTTTTTITTGPVPMQTISKEDTPLTTMTTKSVHDKNDDTDDDNNGDDDDDNDTDMTVIILDSAQTKFPIPCHSNWTLAQFQQKGAKIHKVPPPQQRLIFRGKMLSNERQTLKEYKLQHQVIVHLFPKPRVVVTNSQNSQHHHNHNNHNANEFHSSASTMTTAGAGTSGDGGGSGGAHIPHIIIDEEEQQRRGQILVLGSVEIAESQNNVKMLSLLLLVICSMRLLALLSIWLGVAEEPVPAGGGGDDGNNHNNSTHPPHNNNNNNPYNDPQDMEIREWRPSDYFDLAVSAIGFYVATLGMKATQENTSRLATLYFLGTIVAGIGWNAWNVFMYYTFYEEETEKQNNHIINGNTDDDLPPLTRDDFITVAFFTVAMPLFVWGVCCARAWEFRRLIEEAEEEAAERIRSQVTTTALIDEEEEGDDDDDDEDHVHGHNHGSSASIAGGRELTNLSLSRTEIV